MRGIIVETVWSRRHMFRSGEGLSEHPAAMQPASQRWCGNALEANKHVAGRRIDGVGRIDGMTHIYQRFVKKVEIRKQT